MACCNSHMTISPTSPPPNTMERYVPRLAGHIRLIKKPTATNVKQTGTIIDFLNLKPPWNVLDTRASNLSLSSKSCRHFASVSCLVVSLRKVRRSESPSCFQMSNLTTAIPSARSLLGRNSSIVVFPVPHLPNRPIVKGVGHANTSFRRLSTILRCPKRMSRSLSAVSGRSESNLICFLFASNFASDSFMTSIRRDLSKLTYCLCLYFTIC
ncbi:hypothetical protein ES703_27068 [subsurface metagenome]